MRASARKKRKSQKRDKRDRRTLAERQTAKERRALIEAVKQRRGIRVDFTERRLGSIAKERGGSDKIVRCNECGKKGILSKALFPSLLIIHRGLIKNNKFSLIKSKFNSDDCTPPHCVNSPGTIVA